MNAMVSPTLLAQRRSPEVHEQADGCVDFAMSGQFACHYDRSLGALWSTWRSSGIPCFTLELLRDMEHASQLIESHFSAKASERSLSHIVVRSLNKKAFNVGGDLGYFARLIQAGDRARLNEYARAAIEVQYRNYISHNLRGVTTVALLEGDALGGGFECALSCDVVIAERHVKAGFPEVMFNMFPGMGGLTFVARRASRQVADQMARSGRLYSAQELYELGLVDEVVDMGEGPNAVTRLIRQRACHRSAHDALNKVERLVRPVSLQELYDVTKIWVDCAIDLDERSLAWMRRLNQRQLQLFGHGLELVAPANAMGAEIAA
jgi:DSF synthase